MGEYRRGLRHRQSGTPDFFNMYIIGNMESIKVAAVNLNNLHYAYDYGDCRLCRISTKTAK